jgi:DNA polymerase III alpha subunit (gram-positive type)
LAQKQEVYIVVDIEASGPSPSDYALLSIGACTVEEPGQTFYVELRPDRRAFTSEAMVVNGLSLDRLTAEGLPPAEAMQAFSDWVAQVVPPDARPVFVAFNAPFDWMFVNDYFHRYLGNNPFGHSALDIKAYYMGLHGVAWGETSHAQVGKRYSGKEELAHDALSDAMDEAEILRAMLGQQERDFWEGKR